MKSTRSTEPTVFPGQATGQGIVTVTGCGVSGGAGDGEPAVQAQSGFPAGLAVDAAGSVYIADHANHRVGRDGLLATMAAADGRCATEALLSATLRAC